MRNKCEQEQNLASVGFSRGGGEKKYWGGEDGFVLDFLKDITGLV